MTWTSTKEDAFKDYIRPSIHKAKWIEDSKKISDEIDLSKRELLGLILIAHALRDHFKTKWIVGYDPDDGEPNDGFVTDTKSKHIIEHKVVAQMDPREVLDAIKSTYTKYSDKGAEYGKGRTLFIHANKSSDHGGLVKISELRELIDGESPFDQVYTVGLVAARKGKLIFHIIKHYPVVPSGTAITQIDLYLNTGAALVQTNGMHWYHSDTE
ncbi:hypothetical protein [Neptuniibacter sp.]|uniref:hypothetical protein n=1 Tax=Neptuniibacter sp. TaxID=1962643 RepID=UPI003B5C0CC5